MTISRLQTLNALYVSGATATINYTKFISTSIPDIVFYVSSSATTFYIDLVPTSSRPGITFHRQDNSLINETSKLRLTPSTQKIPVIARINTSDFNNATESQRPYDIKINFESIEIPIANQNTSSESTNGSICNGFPTCFDIDPTDVQAVIEVCGEGYQCINGCCVTFAE